MNLLQDDWIPVQSKGARQKISLRTLLCTEGPYQMCLRQSDMEMAAVQLCVSLVQALFCPATNRERQAAIKKPMAESEYAANAVSKIALFELESASPFMQDGRLCEMPVGSGVGKCQKMELQKLFPGMPEGKDAGCLFIKKDRIIRICPSCAAIALYNQGSCAPSFGGGFKAPLRGQAPITTFVFNPDLRKMVWSNVLPKDDDWVRSLLNRNEAPSWVEPVENPSSTVYATELGMLRGLFWQPASLLLLWKDVNSTCDACGMSFDKFATEMKTRKWGFKYSWDQGTNGVRWAHPHTPYCMDSKTRIVPASFKTDLPLWANLSEILPAPSGKGATMAASVRSFADSRFLDDIVLSIGGYRNDQAKILERRHEIFSIRSGSEAEIGNIRAVVQIGQDIRKLVWKAARIFFKSGNKLSNGKGISGIKGSGERKNPEKIPEKIFMNRTFTVIMDTLGRFSDPEAQASIRKRLKEEGEKALLEAALPYRNDPHYPEVLAYALERYHSEFRKKKNASKRGAK